MSYDQVQGNGFLMPNGVIQHPAIAAPLLCPSNTNARLRWTPELHEIFVIAVQQLGGATKAKPTAIMQAMQRMGVFGITIRQVKSHLQKYRNKGKEGAGEQSQDAEDDTPEGQTDGTSSTVMVPTPGIGGQAARTGEASQTVIGSGIIRGMQTEEPLQKMQGAQPTYAEDPCDPAIREFFSS